MVMQEFLILVIFTAVLAKASSLVVDNAAKLARFFRISTLAIGLLFISISTSLPELSVSVISSVAGEGAISAGNVFGSNIANILLVLGLGAAIFGFRVERKILPDIALVLVATTILSAYIIYQSEVKGADLGFYEGVLLLLAFVLYSWHTLSRKSARPEKQERRMSMHEGFYSFIFFFGGLVAVIISASFVVDSAVSLARIAGLAESFIGATIIAIGTSLPELTIDLQAFRKKQYGVALGDAIGSNMVNITLVLGTAAALSPIVINYSIFIAALLFAVVANTLFFYVAAVKQKFDRTDGVVMITLYVAFIVAMFYLQFS